ncbi:MAG: arylsulfatase [Prolixibacteraceae bacterium]
MNIKHTLTAVTSMIVLLTTSCNTTNNQQADKTSVKPNIIYILADDMGYGDLGCYGQQKIQTPTIDKLAGEGILFTQHYAGNTVCAPSRCALLTGKDMGHADVRGNVQVKPSGQLPIKDETITVAEALKKAGYTTGMIGKWGLGNYETSGNPNKQGFDYFYGYTDQVLAHNYWPEYLLRNGEKEYLKNEVTYLDKNAWHEGLGSISPVKKEFSNDLFTNDALQFIERNKTKPFFLYLPYTIPHDNGEAPVGQRQEVPDFGIYKNNNWQGDSLGYAAQITRLDTYVAQILQKLKDLNLDNNTILFFSSDNGPLADMEYCNFFDSNGKLRGGKRDLYEGGIRIPLIVRWPGKIKPNTTSDHISAFWDFMPTACEIADIEIPETNGISFLPTLLDKHQKQHDYIYHEFYEIDGKQSLRKGNWKAVRNNVYKDPNGQPELYDLSKDISEQQNIADQYPDVVKELVRLMKEASTPSEIFTFDK